MGAAQLLVKPMHTRILLRQIEDLIASHEQKLAQLGLTSAAANTPQSIAAKKASAKKVPTKKPAAKKAKKDSARKPTPIKKKAVTKKVAAVAKEKPLAKRPKPSLKRTSYPP